MGTKAKVKNREKETDERVKKENKKRGILLFRRVHKRKRLSQSQEFLHDTRDQNFKIELEIDEKEEKENDINMERVNVIKHHEQNKEDDIIRDGYGKNDGAEVTTDKHKVADEKKRLFSSPIKFLKNSFTTKKRRKHTEYSKFSESTDNILVNSQYKELSTNGDSVDGASHDMKQTKKTFSKRYVRFETGDDDDKENMTMTIDEAENVTDNQPHSSSTIPEKKKKSAKKKIAKASRKTGRVFREGMILVGRNLQYLSPMPTPHVFAEPDTKKKSDYTDTPKKRNYKYTARAPPANPYGFV